MSFYEAALHHQTGDIIFTRDRDLVSLAIRAGQTAMERKPAPYSHVTMCAFPGLFVDSVPKKGVRVYEIEGDENDTVIINSTARLNIKILRLKNAQNYSDKLIDAISYWTGQEYSFRYIQAMGMRDGSTFCSQFVSQIFEKAGILLQGKPLPLFVTPSNLLDRMIQAGASDVTDQYKILDNKMKESNVDGYFEDDWARRAIKMRFLQSKNVVLAKGIDEFTVLSIVRQQVTTAEMINDVMHRNRTFYRPIFEASNNFRTILICLSSLKSSDLIHWSEKLNSVESNEILKIVARLIAVIEVAVLYLDKYSKIMSDLNNELIDIEANFEECRYGEYSKYCQVMFSDLDIDQENEIDSAFAETRKDIDRFTNYVASASEMRQKFAKQFEDLNEKWANFKKSHFELRKSFLILVDLIEEKGNEQ